MPDDSANPSRARGEMPSRHTQSTSPSASETRGGGGCEFPEMAFSSFPQPVAPCWKRLMVPQARQQSERFDDASRHRRMQMQGGDKGGELLWRLRRWRMRRTFGDLRRDAQSLPSL